MLNVEIGTLCLYSPEVHCLHLTLITASLNGGWVPRVYRSFHFWQPVPRLKNAFMADTMVQPSHDPPTHKETKGTCHSENISGERRIGRRGGKKN